MKTVTFVAYNRPKYTARSILAFAAALCKEPDFFDQLIFSIDPGCDEVVSVCEAAATALSSLLDVELYVNDQLLGVAMNPLAALTRAFEVHDSSFNLHLEDDACLTPDAISFAKWFYLGHGGPLSNYLLASMCNHRDFGRGVNPGRVPNDPSYIAEAAHLPAPFAFCLSRWQWPFVQSTWCCKKLPPDGWDYSLSYAMRFAKHRALHPVLSRCKNIGREGGVHESNKSYDAVNEGLTHSDGSYSGNYKIVVRVPDSELVKIDPWMVLEWEASKELEQK